MAFIWIVSGFGIPGAVTPLNVVKTSLLGPRLADFAICLIRQCDFRTGRRACASGNAADDHSTAHHPRRRPSHGHLRLYQASAIARSHK
jgi:hypothetical protein